MIATFAAPPHLGRPFSDWRNTWFSQASMKPLNQALLYSLLCMAMTPAHGAEGVVQIYDLAVASDPAFRSESALLEAARETGTQSRGRLLPTVALSGNTRSNHQDVRTQGIGNTGEIDFNSNELSLTVEQPVFHHDYFIKLNQAKAIIGEAENRFRAAGQDLMARSVEAYLEYLRAQDNLEFTLAEIRAAKVTLEQTRSRYEQGASTAADLHGVQADHDLLVAERTGAESALLDSRQALAEITGLEHHELQRVNMEKPLLAPEPADVQAWTDTANSLNPELAATRHAVESAMKDVEIERGGHFPVVDVVAEYSAQETGGRFGDTEIDDTSVSLKFRWPLFEGGQVNSRVREATHILESERLVLERMSRQTRRETHDAYNATLSNLNKANALRQAVASTALKLDATRAGYEAGTMTPADVLDAERELLRTKKEHAGAIYDYFINMLRLKQAAGSLQREDIVAMESWLEK